MEKHVEQTEKTTSLSKVKTPGRKTDTDDKAIYTHHSQTTPVNSQTLWAKMTPEEHYHRLCQYDDEAWQHLGDLIWVCIAQDPRMYKILHRGGITIEDQVRNTLAHILGKIRDNCLHLDHPEKFYGLMKIIAINLMRDVLRSEKVEDGDNININIASDQLSHKKQSECSNQCTLEAELITKFIWEAILTQSPIKNPKHRRALALSIEMKMGIISISNNSEIAKKLSEEFGEEVSYAKASGWIHLGKTVLVEYLRKNGLHLK